MEPWTSLWFPSGPRSARMALIRSRNSVSTGRPSKHHTPACTLIVIAPSAFFPDAILQPHVTICFVDRASVYFYPRMCSEWVLLSTQNHSCGHALISKQASGHSRALQTHDAFRIPHQGMVDSIAHALNGFRSHFAAPHRPVADNPMYSRKFLARRSEEHTSELQSPCNLVCRLLLEKKKNKSSIRDIIVHLIDTVRVFVLRSFSIVRADDKSLQRIDVDEYILRCP